MENEEPKRRSFRAERKEEEFDVGGVAYIMREMDGTLRGQYQDFLLTRLKTTSEGKSAGISKASGIEAYLLCRCVIVKDTGKFVDAKMVDSWPAGEIEEIANWAQEFNSLDVKAEERAKNV